MDESELINKQAGLISLELRNVTDYEMLGKVDEGQAHTVVDNAKRFVAHCETYLTTKGYL